MNKVERIKAVKAMEFLARCCNNENHMMTWLTDGVADGDIDIGDLEVHPEDAENLEYYIDDDEKFADLMDTFLYCMKKARRNGGLYIDEVVSKASEG